MNATDTAARRILVALGWRIRTTGEYRQALKHFQTAQYLGEALSPTGIAGPKTMHLLNVADERRRRGLPTASRHFSFVEFRCKCGGRYSNCARIWVKRDLIRRLEDYRAGIKQGVGIVSGCRCPGWNHDQRGASSSKHMIGTAADFAPVASVRTASKYFLGVGYNPAGRVRHGDLGPRRAWRYGS